MIIGVSGYTAGGKDSAVHFFEKNGFIHYSLSDMLREKLKTKGLEITRHNLQELGNNLRTEHGASVLAYEAIDKMRLDKNYVISSIGSVGEVEAFAQHPAFRFLFIDAPQKIRFERIKARKREQDPRTLKEFKRHEAIESKGNKANYRAFDVLKKSAHIIVNNDKTLDDFYKKLQRLLANLERVRPSWDEYFLHLMNVVRSRGTCDRGKTGCIIVKEKKILASGYVGSAVGQPHCDEVGHDLKKILNSDGTISNHCVRTIHGEQNAIAQAAKLGISIDGATVYTYMEPCEVCAKILVNAGIVRVVAERTYHRGKEARKILRMAGIDLKIIFNTTTKYAKQ